MEELEDMEGTGVLWDALLNHAQANLAQARANEETSRAMHLLTQRMPNQGVIEMVPDRLESWYAAECDAEAGVSIAEKIVKQAEGVLDPGTGEEQRGSRGKGEAQPPVSSSFTKTAVGTKKRVPSVFELLAAGGNKLEEPEKVEEPEKMKNHERLKNQRRLKNQKSLKNPKRLKSLKRLKNLERVENPKRLKNLKRLKSLKRLKNHGLQTTRRDQMAQSVARWSRPTASKSW